MAGDLRQAGAIEDRLLGAIGGGMMLIAVLLLIFGGAGDTEQAVEGTPPQMRLLSPADGDTVPSPVQLHFESDAPLSVQPGGWGAAGFHIHAEVDGREAMPGPADIRRAADGSYVWSLAAVPAGERALRLLWSDGQHAPVGSGSDAPISVVIQ
ncbi:MAG: hypothetical protein WD737_09135 [Gemmatimonadota bacterium]